MAYNKQVRFLVIVHRFQLNRHPAEIARLLQMSVSTVRRILARYNATGSVETKRIGRPPISLLLTRPQLLILFEYVLSNETAYLKEMVHTLNDVTGSLLLVQSMHYVLKRYGYSRKRVCVYLFTVHLMYYKK